MERENKNNIQTRSFILLLLVFLCFGLIIFRLFNIQVVEGDYYKSKALRQQVNTVAIDAKRGNIYDRNQKILAQSAVVWDVCISPNDIKEENWPLVANGLAGILEIEPQEILKHKGRDTYYAIITPGVDNQTREKVAQFMEANSTLSRNVYFEESLKRFYTYDSLGSTILGFTDNDHHGAYGLEAYYDAVLSGTPGVKVGYGGDSSSIINYSAQDGHSLVLTIDEVVQASAEKHLEMAMTEHNIANGGSVIVMNIQTGEILGMTSKPDFNPNEPYVITDDIQLKKLEALDEDSKEYKEELEFSWFNQWRNRAIAEPYEPGSVYKLVTMAIALEEEKTFMDDYFYCSGSIKVLEEIMNCWSKAGHGEQNLYDIMRNSCNPAFVTLGSRNTAKTTFEYMKYFGLSNITGIDLPGEVNSLLLPTKEKMNAVELASTSFGQSNKVTPIQLLVAISATINGGHLVEPHVVRQVMDSQNNVIETVEPKVKRQVISEETSKKIQILAETVVANGTGRNAAIPGYRIGGKTGTSEKLDILIRERRKAYVLSFVSFAPMDNPTYAVLVVLDEPELDDPWGSVIAAPIAGAIMQEILPYLGIEPQYTAEELSNELIDTPYLIGKKPHDAQAELTKLGLKTQIIGQSGSVLRQVPLAGRAVTKGSRITLFSSEEEMNTNITMPDLLTLTRLEAEEILLDLYLNISPAGDTVSKNSIVTEQWPLAGEKLTSADQVKVTFGSLQKKNKLETLPELPDTFQLPEDIVEPNPEEFVPPEQPEETPETQAPDPGNQTIVDEDYIKKLQEGHLN